MFVLNTVSVFGFIRNCSIGVIAFAFEVFVTCAVNLQLYLFVFLAFVSFFLVILLSVNCHFSASPFSYDDSKESGKSS